MQLLTGLQDRIVEYSPKVLIGIVILLVSWIIANLLRRILVRLGSKLDDSKRCVVHLCATVCRWGVLAVGIITGLGTIDVNVSALVAGLGLTGFALGFALKDALSNLMSGVLLLVYQPFTNGDWISVSGCEGKVMEINMRYTVIEKEKDRYLIPNSTLLTNTVRVSGKT
ncbi:MAG: mechanosensitive ion channel domain-containing protein [Candidatus Desantisbacteria bacterium]